MRDTLPERPRIVIPESVDAPMARSETMPNGMRIYILDCSQSDVQRVSFVTRAGTSWQDKPFSATAAVNLLSEGTRSCTSLEISQNLDRYGSFFDVSVDRDYSMVTFCCLDRFFEPTMELAAEIMLEPVFPQSELDLFRMKRKEQLILNRAKPEFVAREAFGQALFGPSHPYGISSHESLYDSLTRDDVVALYSKLYTASNSFIVVSGKVSEKCCDVIRNLASRFPVSQTIPSRVFPDVHTTFDVVRPMDGAVQTSLRIGKMMFPRQHPDFVGMQVVSCVLGGYFGSRLLHNLRERHGYTYGVYSAMINFDRAGYFAIATDVARESADDAVREVFAEIDRLIQDGVSESELDMVRNIMVGEMMRVLDGPFGIADVTVENIQNGTDNAVIDRTVRSIRSMTCDDVVEMARKYLSRDGFVTVRVG